MVWASEDEKDWRLSINHSNPQQGNVYKTGHAFYYMIRRLNSGYEPSREGEARWMYESDKGWEVYDQAHSDEIEDAWQSKKKSVTIITSREQYMWLKHLQQFQDGADNTKAERVRRQQLSKGISRMWQVLTVTYSPPYWLRGASVIEIFDKVWKGMETMSGRLASSDFSFCTIFWVVAFEFAYAVATTHIDSQRSCLNSILTERKRAWWTRSSTYWSVIPHFVLVYLVSRIRVRWSRATFQRMDGRSWAVSPLHNLFQALIPQLREYVVFECARSIMTNT